MKNVFKVLGIIALVAVIGFGLVSCGGDDDNNNNNNNNNSSGGGVKWRSELAYENLGEFDRGLWYDIDDRLEMVFFIDGTSKFEFVVSKGSRIYGNLVSVDDKPIDQESSFTINKLREEWNGKILDVAGELTFKYKLNSASEFEITDVVPSDTVTSSYKTQFNDIKDRVYNK